MLVWYTIRWLDYWKELFIFTGGNPGQLINGANCQTPKIETLVTFLKGVDPKRLTSVAEHVLDVKQLVVIERREQVMEGMVTVHYQGQK